MNRDGLYLEIEAEMLRRDKIVWPVWSPTIMSPDEVQSWRRDLILELCDKLEALQLVDSL